jgi:hypothetical protein
MHECRASGNFEIKHLRRRKVETKETIEINDLEPTGEVKGGQGVGLGPANLIAFDTATPVITSGIGQNGALMSLAGNNTPVGATTVRTGSVFTITFGGNLA